MSQKITQLENPAARYNFKLLIVWVNLYILLLVLTGIGLHKTLYIGGLHIQVSTLILPFAFVLCDVITEVYGYRIGRQLVLSVIPATVLYQLGLLFVVDVPGYSGIFGHAYHVLFDSTQLVGFLGDAGIVVGFYLNTYFLTKWRILTKGRYFWLRSVGSSCIGEIIQIMIGLVGIVWAGYWQHNDIYHWFLIVLITRLVIIAVMAAPATLLVRWLKRFEKVADDYSPIRFMPFKLPKRDPQATLH